MQKFTQADFDKFEVINGVVQCPTGDYSLINTFAKFCSFAVGCSFAERCSFAKFCSVVNHDLSGFKMRQMSGLGDYGRMLYLWCTDDGFFVQAGCFFGSESDFVTAVTAKYSADHKYIRAIEFLKSE